ncbi:MAG: transporter substrate-binding domain-containing protein [Proteobacteria bacterium]|nr:transporter substrate-binding domain-containing protein [Pseudomonadota bacterium]
MAVIFVLYSGPAPAGPADGRLVLSYNEDGYPPYLIEEDDRITGITVEILQQALKRIDFELTITLHPEKRGQELLERGEVDARGKAREWVQHPEQYDWTEPFLEPSTIIVSSTRTPIRTPSIQAMQDMSIAAILGFSYPPLEQAFLQGLIQRVDVHNAQKQLFLTHMGRVDGAVIDDFTAQWLMAHSKEYTAKDFYIASPAVETVGYRLMFTRQQDWKPFIKLFDAEIKRMQQDGSIQMILDKYN